MDYPRLMFRTPGPDQCQGGTYATQVVQSDDDFEARIAEGWHSTLPEALAPAQNAPEPANLAEHIEDPDPATLTTQEQTDPPTYDEMKAKATELGLEFRSNISKAALLALVTAKLAEQA